MSNLKIYDHSIESNRDATAEEAAEIEARKSSAPDLLKAAYNAKIYSQLDEIDKKSIRALRDNDAQYIAAYKSEAAALRAQLQK